MNWKRIVLSLVAVGVLVVIAVLIFGKKTIDQGDLESKLATQVSKQSGIASDKLDVSCPDGIEAEKGKTFDCTATSAGQKQKLVLTIKLTDDNGGYVVTGSKAE